MKQEYSCSALFSDAEQKCVHKKWKWTERKFKIKQYKTL
jgi:hypothetical protein